MELRNFSQGAVFLQHGIWFYLLPLSMEFVITLLNGAAFLLVIAISLGGFAASVACALVFFVGRHS
jgi:uncharacterized membrane protein YdjX (TVP38/TMEM64 family)